MIIFTVWFNHKEIGENGIDVNKYIKRSLKNSEYKNTCRNNYLYSTVAFYVEAPRSLAAVERRISGDFHRNVAVYHAVKNIARIIRRCSNWIYIRNSWWFGLSATQGHSYIDKWVFFSNGKGENRCEKIRV